MQLNNEISKYINLFIERGILGRKRQMIYCLSKEKDSGFNLNKAKRDKLYKKIRNRYTEIRVHRLWSTRLGEYITRFLAAAEDSAQNAAKGILDVFVLTDCVNCNSRLSQVMGRTIQIIDEKNADVWMYILCRFPKVEFTEYWNDYTIRSKDRLLNAKDTAKYFIFTKEEEKEGRYKKELMKLQGSYVCVSSRDSVYLSTVMPDVNCHYHDYRDSDINRLNLSADYLSQKGITMVRMGRYVRDKVTFPNCIDYANKYYDEFMDIFLVKECKFALLDPNGICILPMALNIPVAFKNGVGLALVDGWGEIPRNSQSLLIFKKYYKKSENRFLSFDEMMKVDVKVRSDGRKYAKLGIEVVENTAEEILDLTMEMNARIDGEWIETPEDFELQKEYRTIFQRWCKKMNFNDNAVYQGRIGALFLRKNKFLLEKREES